MSALMPVAGIGLTATPRYSRGYLVTGATHLAYVPEGGVPSGAVTTLCGREIRYVSTWGADVTPRFVDEWHRIGRTHETGLCSRCMQHQDAIASTYDVTQVTPK